MRNFFLSLALVFLPGFLLAQPGLSVDGIDAVIRAMSEEQKAALLVGEGRDSIKAYTRNIQGTMWHILPLLPRICRSAPGLR